MEEQRKLLSTGTCVRGATFSLDRNPSRFHFLVCEVVFAKEYSTNLWRQCRHCGSDPERLETSPNFEVELSIEVSLVTIALGSQAAKRPVLPGKKLPGRREKIPDLDLLRSRDQVSTFRPSLNEYYWIFLFHHSMDNMSSFYANIYLCRGIQISLYNMDNLRICWLAWSVSTVSDLTSSGTLASSNLRRIQIHSATSSLDIILA